MDNLPQQIFNILITPPGNLVYHLILAFSVMAALQSAISNRRNRSLPFPGRIVFGLSLLLFAQLILFVSSGLAWQHLANPQRYLPPLDRAISAFSLLWIAWLWCFPKSSRLADSFTGVLSLAVVIMTLFTLNNWVHADLALPFNQSIFDLGWEGFALVVALIGILILLIKQPSGWGIGFAVLGLLAAGYVINLLQSTSMGDFSGILRLTQLCAFPLLPALAQRVSQESDSDLTGAQNENPKDKIASNNPRLVQAWMQLAAESNPQYIGQAIVQAVAQTMAADLGFLITTADENGRWRIKGGYDLVSEVGLPGTSLNQDQIPSLSTGLQRGKPVHLNAESRYPDLKSIGTVFNLDGTGKLLAAPLISSGKVWGGIVLLNHYSDRDWTNNDEAYFLSLAEGLMPILQRAENPAFLSPGELPALQANLAAVQKQMNDLRQENLLLAGKMSTFHAPEGQSIAGHDIDALLAVQTESQDLIASLQAENERLQNLLLQPVNDSPRESSVDQLEAELRMTLEEIAHLQNTLAQANMKIMDLQGRAASKITSRENSEWTTSIAQELRQPMSSIISYVDLLLAESAGSLAPTQRKYLDRVNTSVEQIRSMLDDLIRVSVMHSGSLDLSPRPVSLSDQIDAAISANRHLLREKNITIQVDLKDPLPTLQSDPDALRQILVDLLRNAGSISAENGLIMLRVLTEQPEDGQPVLHLQVRDSGGGIAEEDLARVFAPVKQAEVSLISGVSNNGCGLPVAHALVKALGGNMMVENDPGKSATYSIRLPLLQTANDGISEPA